MFPDELDALFAAFFRLFRPTAQHPQLRDPIFMMVQTQRGNAFAQAVVAAVTTMHKHPAPDEAAPEPRQRCPGSPDRLGSRAAQKLRHGAETQGKPVVRARGGWHRAC